ncbi:hypothetical protein V0R37_04795 [Pollutimonas sp. H1-120]|uniref:hypothetical protein n=1 Tax=Pollutimonas sp. H1-120 TaxID=3148824 RepID=UPI003B52CE69
MKLKNIAFFGKFFRGPAFFIRNGKSHKKWDTWKVSHKHPLQKGGEEEKPKRTMIGGSRIVGNTPFIQISQKPCD